MTRAHSYKSIDLGGDMSMIRYLIGIEIFVSIVFLILVVLVYVLVGGSTSGVDSIWDVFLYWGTLFCGPLLLLIGSVLSAIGKRNGPLTSFAGALILTLCVAYQLLLTIRAQHTLDDNPYMPYILVFALFLSLAADTAAYFVMKLKGLWPLRDGWPGL
jgi:CDP-diglyceride synthetase